MVAFGNTEVAFKGKSNGDLSRAQLLFRVIGNPFLSWLGKHCTVLAIKLRLPVKGLIKATIFKQFCGGEDIEDSMDTSAQLAFHKVGTILDHSVEGEDDEEGLDYNMWEILKTVKAAADNKHIPFCVFKPSGVARVALLEKVSSGAPLDYDEKISWESARDRFDIICKAAFNAGTPVLIDAEESWVQDAVDKVVEDLMARYNQEKAVVYNTVQLYRHDRLQYLKDLKQRADSGGYYVGVKLVRGAYMEKERERAEERGYPSPIQPDKESSNRDYNAAQDYCLEHLDRVALCSGTHNEESCALLAAAMEQKGIAKDDGRVFFAQLLGMSDHISFNLAEAGYNVAKYVPYGPVKEVLPYLMRRASENRSIEGQTGRELSLLIKEKRRRKGIQS